LSPPSSGQSPTPSQSDDDLPLAVSHHDFDTAKREFEQAYDRPADRLDVFSWLGETAFKTERWDTAVASFEQIPSDTPRYGHIARLFQGRALIKLNRAPAAEKNLREFLRLEEASPELKLEHFAEALLQLQYLMAIELRFEDRRKVLGALLELGFLEHAEVLNYCFPTLHRWNGNVAADALEAFWQQDPQDPWLRAERGRYRQGQGLLDEAREILEECHRDYPQSLNAAAGLLSCLYEDESWEEMATIVDQLPPVEDHHPWLLLRMRGHVYNHQDKFHEAIDCFERALNPNPPDSECWAGLGTAYAGLKDQKNQLRCAAMSAALARIQNRIGAALDHPDDPEVLLEIAELAEQNSLEAECKWVVRLALHKHPRHEKLLALQRRLRGQGDSQ
jgi:tetratricopeptide (TPR) repeat protein